MLLEEVHAGGARGGGGDKRDGLFFWLREVDYFNKKVGTLLLLLLG